MSGFLGQDVLSQIRAANDIVDVIQSLNVPLKKAGNQYKALCPFHKEKSPSFSVSPQRQSFHCFGCGEGGDVYKFVMKREGLNFIEAVRRLADRAHITLPETNFIPSGPDRSHKQLLYDLHTKVRDWFHTNLMRSRQAEGARAYLKSRGFSAEVAKTYKLGYALSAWEGLIDWAKTEKISTDLLEEAGLIVPKNNRHYDRFRDRLMIPICDESGRVVGFSGRLLVKEAKEAKYVNSPETPIFKKGMLLFGLDRSKRHLQDSKTAIICEGQLDWIRCFESGVKNVVAPQGTAFTEDHARILGRYVEQVVMCYDSDNAGQKATWKNAEILLPTGISVRTVQMPEGEDPDSFVRKKGGEAFQKLIEGAMDIFEARAISLGRSLNMNDARNHQKVFQEMIPLILLIENEPQRKKIIQNICDIVGMDHEPFFQEFQKYRQKKMAYAPQDSGSKMDINPVLASTGQDQVNRYADQLLQLALSEKSIASFLAEQLNSTWLEGYGLKNVLLYILDRAKQGFWGPGWDGIPPELDEVERNAVARLLTQPLELDHRSMAHYLQNCFIGLKRAYLVESEKRLLIRLKDPKISDKDRLSCQTELLDLARQMKQI